MAAHLVIFPNLQMGFCLVSVLLCAYALKITKVVVAPEYLRRYPGLCRKLRGVSKQPVVLCKLV